MHHRKLILVLMFISLIHAYNAVRVETDVTPVTEKSESVDDQQQPKAEALTLVIHKHLPLRPVKVIERKDDVVVIHKRAKRKQNSRRRRPSSNQFRSKIKPSSSSNFGGFKDFSSNDLRFPLFSNKPRASNKYKFGPPRSQSQSHPERNSHSRRPPQPQRSPSPAHSFTQIYGPPAFNHIDTPFNQPITLQQQQASFPHFSINAIEPVSTNNYGNNNDITRFSSPISNFPLGDGSSFNSPSIPKTSYGEPVRSASTPTNSYQYNSNVANVANVLSQLNKQNPNSNYPKLPSRYEQSEFSTPTRHSPINSNSFSNDFGNFDLSETKNVLSTANSNRNKNNQNRFNKFNNYDYDFRNQKNQTPNFDNDDEDDDDEEENLDYIFSTRRPRPTVSTTTPFTTSTRKTNKGIFGQKRKRPVNNNRNNNNNNNINLNSNKISQSGNDHNLDTDDLRDAFSESSNDFHEVALSSDDFLNFDSQRNTKRSQNAGNLHQHEIHSTLKTARKNPALRSALGDDFQILSIHKSLEKDPNGIDPLEFRRRGDEYNENKYQEFQVGGEINFSDPPVNSWSGDMNQFPRNHRFS